MKVVFILFVAGLKKKLFLFYFQQASRYLQCVVSLNFVLYYNYYCRNKNKKNQINKKVCFFLKWGTPPPPYQSEAAYNCMKVKRHASVFIFICIFKTKDVRSKVFTRLVTCPSLSAFTLISQTAFLGNSVRKTLFHQN